MIACPILSLPHSYGYVSNVLTRAESCAMMSLGQMSWMILLTEKIRADQWLDTRELD